MTPPRTFPRYVFSGHAIGAAGHIRRIGTNTGLNHLIPAQAASVLPPTGGLAQGASNRYRFPITDPRPMTLFSVDKASSSAVGRCLDNEQYETEVQVDIENMEWVEKLRIGLVRLHMLSKYKMGDAEPTLSTNGSKLEGVMLGNVEAKIELDDTPLPACAAQPQLATHYRNQDAGYRQQYAWRYATPAGAPEISQHGVYYRCSIVKHIELVGPESEKAGMSVDGYSIKWPGFGKIVLGEIHVKGNDRQITMVRLAMGSDAGGSGSGGSGQSNGAVSGG